MLSFQRTADAYKLAAAWMTLCRLTRADVLGLRWSDINLDAGIVTVRQGRVQLSSGVTPIEEPKSHQRRRVVPVEVIHQGTADLLRKLKANKLRTA